MSDLSEKVRTVLINEGVDNEGGIHGWRCFDKERYPEPCDCMDEVVAEVMVVVDAAVVAAEQRVWDENRMLDIKALETLERVTLQRAVDAAKPYHRGSCRVYYAEATCTCGLDKAVLATASSPLPKPAPEPEPEHPFLPQIMQGRPGLCEECGEPKANHSTEYDWKNQPTGIFPFEMPPVIPIDGNG